MEAGGDEMATIKELLKNEPRGLSIRQITDQLPVNRNLVAKYLDMLLVSGQVEMRTIGMAKIYYLSHRVPISAMMDFSSDFIIVLDENLRIIQINDHFLEFSGRTREEIVGKTIEGGTLPVLAGDSSLASARDALRGKEIAEDIVYSQKEAVLHYHAKYIPTVFENGAPGVTVIIEETTGIWNAEQTLRTALREKEVLLGDINQRINNNLQLIRSFIELQMATLSDTPAQGVLRETENRIMALALVYAQIGAATPGSRVELDSYISDLAKALCASYHLPAGCIAATAETPGVTMDEDRATTAGLVLNELASYLLQATDGHGTPVSVTIGLTGTAGTGITFRIGYSGKPIPGPIDLPTTDVLGLQLAFALVTKQLGGSLGITEDRQGFVIDLPPD